MRSDVCLACRTFTPGERVRGTRNTPDARRAIDRIGTVVRMVVPRWPGPRKHLQVAVKWDGLHTETIYAACFVDRLE